MKGEGMLDEGFSLVMLPKPALARVFLFLPVADAGKLACLSKRFNEAFCDEVAWKERLHQEQWPEGAIFPTSAFQEAFRCNIWSVLVSCEHHSEYGHVVYESFRLKVHAHMSVRELQLLLAQQPKLEKWVNRKQISCGFARRKCGDAERKREEMKEEKEKDDEVLWKSTNIKPVLGAVEDARKLCEFRNTGPSCTIVLRLFFQA
jgi:hypothetical protein